MNLPVVPVPVYSPVPGNPYIGQKQWCGFESVWFWASWIRIRHYLYGSGSFHHQAKSKKNRFVWLFLLEDWFWSRISIRNLVERIHGSTTPDKRLIQSNPYLSWRSRSRAICRSRSKRMSEPGPIRWEAASPPYCCFSSVSAVMPKTKQFIIPVLRIRIRGLFDP